MTGTRSTRGRPLVALIVLMVAWVGVRAAFWDTAAISAVKVPEFASLHIADTADSAGPDQQAAGAALETPVGPYSMPGEGLFAFEEDPRQEIAPSPATRPDRVAGAPRMIPYDQAIARRLVPREFGREQPGPTLFNPFVAPPYEARMAPVEPVEPRRPVPPRVALAHQMLWMAAVSRMPLPESLFSSAGADGSDDSEAAPPPEDNAARVSRWSSDAWLLLRKGGNAALASGIAPATYGASQMGSVLRYRLFPNSGHRPAAYLRTTAALNGSNEREVALGLSARPIAGVPIAVAAETRAMSRPGSKLVRPAVLAWTELAPFRLPMNTRGEFYAQGGYVGGRYKTPFADGQLRIDHRLVALGRGELRAGGGAWAGAQKGASRLDVGPTATMGVPITKSAFARLAFDWRFRVTGNATPKSRPAVTLSAGF